MLRKKSINVAIRNHSYTTPWHILQGLNILVHRSYTVIFLAAGFIVAGKWNQPKFTSMTEWIMKLRYIQSTECYSDVKKSEIINFAGKRNQKRS